MDPSQEPAVHKHAARALEHVRALAGAIGARPSAGPGEAEAAEYCAARYREAGATAVRLEPFLGSRSTYRPYILALAAGLLAVLTIGTGYPAGGGWTGLILSALGTLAFWAEANFLPHWAERLTPRGPSRNVVAVVPAARDQRGRVVLVAHLDSHRTPVFYRTPVWLRAFGILVGTAFLSLPLVTGVATAVLLGFEAARWLLVPAAAMQLFAVALCCHADCTPHSPGAHDNASGAGSVLALGERLVAEPLARTEVWLLHTGCEETGARGMRAFLGRHGNDLRTAAFLSLDMVGMGRPALLLREGLLRPYRPDPGLLHLARRVAASRPGILAGEHTGGAYTDIGPVIRDGYRGLLVDYMLPAGHSAIPRMGYWHQPEDTPERIEPGALARTHAFVWALLHELDREAEER